MPPDNDGTIVLDHTGQTDEGDVMALDMQEQNMSRLASAGVSAHEHFVTFGKVLDYSYERDRKMVSLVESLGVREVTSASGQAGIPASKV